MSEFTAPSVEELQSKFPFHDIVSFIAQGGMGAVYLATQRSLDRPVAIKILPQEFGEDEDYRVSFETEAKAMAKLNHSNLVGIYDFGDINGMLYIIMEYIPGRSLFDIAHGDQVDQLEAARLIADMCQGLDHAHTAGMLHRDIKPANVLIDDEAKPKIVDFGLARPLGEEQTAGVVFGTPGYTAPEVLTDPLAVDQRSDIFSMGVMLYEMLTGHLPRNPIVPASAVSGSDTRFDRILNKAIHPDPAQRYDSSGEMALALEDLITKFEQAPGLLRSGPLARQSKVLGARPMAAGVLISAGKPVLMSSKPRGNTGFMVGLILALVMGVIFIAGMAGDAGDADPKGLTAAEIREQEQKEEKKRLEAEETRMAEVAKKRREFSEQSEEKRRKLEREEARNREEQRGKEAFAEEQRNKKQLRAKEEEYKQAIAEAEANKKVVIVAIYDHEGFIAEERARITERAATLTRDYKEETDKILDREERDVKRAVRRSTGEYLSKVLEAKVEEFFEKWKKGEKRQFFPEETPAKVIMALNEFISEIAKLDEKLLNDLARYQDTYAKVLHNKSLTLEKENVISSVEAIKAELDALTNKTYFLAIVSDENPSPDDFLEEDEDEEFEEGFEVEEDREKRRRERRERRDEN
ncbi:MAG: hypothetical protein ACJAR1_002730 [Rubritalea sp.]|jgi:hypothetical protein